MRFFLDNDIPPAIARALKELREDVEHLSEKFPRDASDDEWLEYAGRNGIYIITRDKRLRTRPNQNILFHDHKIGAFFLTGNRPFCQLAHQIARYWPQLKELAARSRRPFAFQIPSRGGRFQTIDLSIDPRSWRTRKRRRSLDETR